MSTVVGALLVAAIVGSAGTATFGAAAGLTPADLYARLSDEAARGDAGSVARKAAIDRYLADRGLTPMSLGMPTPTISVVAEGVMRLRIKDMAPWSIRISPDPVLDSRSAIDAYRAIRHTAAEALAAKAPLRGIRAAVSPARLMSLSDLAAMLRCRCRVTYLVVDFFGPKGWIMSGGRSLPSEDLTAGTADAMQQELLEQASASLDQFPALMRAQIRLTVRQLEVEMLSADAVQLAEEPAILIVDPLTDLEDTYRTQAAWIEVDRMPDVLGAVMSIGRSSHAFEPAYEPVSKESR